MKEKFSEFVVNKLNEEKVSTRVFKNVIDCVGDFIQSSQVKLSETEKKEVIDNMEVETEASTTGESGIKFVCTSTFQKDGKFTKNFAVNLEIAVLPITDGETEGIGKVIASPSPMEIPEEEPEETEEEPEEEPEEVEEP